MDKEGLKAIEDVKDSLRDNMESLEEYKDVESKQKEY
jgi:hypothetical protein